jgi:hypothetical protein
MFWKRRSRLLVPGSQQAATVATAGSNGTALIFATATEGTPLNYSRLLPPIWRVLCFARSGVFATVTPFPLIVCHMTLKLEPSFTYNLITEDSITILMPNASNP